MVNYANFPLIFPFVFGDAPGAELIGFTITDGTTILSLSMPLALIESTTNEIQNLVFSSGRDKQLNRGKTNDSLTLSGTETTDAVARMEGLNTFMDDQIILTLSGLPDTNLNTDYRISNLDFVQEAGYPDIYNYNITLERINDRLG